MKKVMFGLLILVLSSFVMAVGSEISTDFYVGSEAVAKDYVPQEGFWDVYGGYISGLIIVLIIVIIYLKRNKSRVPVKVRVRKTKKRSSGKKVKKK